MSEKRTTEEAKQVEISYLAKVLKAMDIAKQAQVGMTLTYFDVIELRGEINSLREYIADLESSNCQLSEKLTIAEGRIADLERIIAKAKNFLKQEMGWNILLPKILLPDDLQQLRQVLDVLDGGGE